MVPEEVASPIQVHQLLFDNKPNHNIKIIVLIVQTGYIIFIAEQ